MTYVFQFGIVWDHWPRLLEGAWMTLRLSAAALAAGLALSVILAFGRRDGPRWLRLLVGAYVEVIRNTPFLVQLFLLYFSLPALGLRMDAWEAALLGMALNFAGYGCEIVRSGMEAVPSGQVEAARALGLTPLRVFRHVVAPQAIAIAWPAVATAFTLYAAAFLGEIWRGAIEAVPREQWEAGIALALPRRIILLRIVLPQALRIAIPPTVGFLVSLVKGTSVAAIIGFVELTRAGQLMVNVTFQPMVVYPVVALLYFAVCWPLSLLALRLERRLERGRA